MAAAPRHCRGFLLRRILASTAAVLVWASAPADAEIRHVTIVHTNDLHDHLRGESNGAGGMAHVAGFIDHVRASSPRTIVLDAGDVTEKGDLVAFRTHSLLTYEALRRIGYDAVVIGNHDFDAGTAWLHKYEQALGGPLLCLNMIGTGGETLFPASRVITAGGLKIGIIGVLVPQDAGTMDFATTGRRLAAEAERLDRDVELVVAVCHAGPDMCAAWSRMAPAVDLFISGHTHERLTKPVVVAGTGARIVQAGSYARFAGRIDLDVSLPDERVVSFQSQVVTLNDETAPSDPAVAAMISNAEKRLCPEAATVVATNSRAVGPDIAWLAAEAMRRAAHTDIGFCNPDYIVREGVPPGPVTVNALFLTGGQRGARTIVTTLTGAEVAAYLNALATTPAAQTAWAGFSVQQNRADQPALRTNLDSHRRYTAIMPDREWHKRFLRAVARAQGRGELGSNHFTASASPVTYLDSLVQLLTSGPSQADLSRLVDQARRVAASPADAR